MQMSNNEIHHTNTAHVVLLQTLVVSNYLCNLFKGNSC